jgi:hypothetical protein
MTRHLLRASRRIVFLGAALVVGSLVLSARADETPAQLLEKAEQTCKRHCQTAKSFANIFGP